MNSKDNKKTFIFDTQITTHAIHLTHSNAINVLNDAKLFLEMQKYVFEFYNLDKICTVYDVYNIESAVIGQKIKYFRNDLPSVDTGNPFIKDKSDIYKIKIKKKEYFKNPRSKFVLDMIDIYKEEFGIQFKPRFCAPFSLAANMLGYERLITDIYEDRRFVEELLKIINTEVLAPWITLQKVKTDNIDIIASGADAWVSIPNVNLEIIEDLIIPSYFELQEMVGSIYLSMLGGARFLKQPEKYLELQKIVNPFLVKGFDPDVDFLGPEFFIDFARKNRMDLLLGMDAGFIQNENLEKISKRIGKYITAGNTIEESFTLYFNDIPSNVSPDKMCQIFDFVRNLRETLS